MKTTQWILVADASKALLLSADGKMQKVTQVDHFSNADGMAAANAQHEDRLGQKGHGSGAHGTMQPRHSAKDLALEAFARRLVDVLERGRQDKKFDALVLVAPSAFLGHLRQHMDAPLQRTALKEHALDLVAEPMPDLVAHLQKLAA